MLKKIKKQVVYYASYRSTWKAPQTNHLCREMPFDLTSYAMKLFFEMTANCSPAIKEELRRARVQLMRTSLWNKFVNTFSKLEFGGMLEFWKKLFSKHFLCFYSHVTSIMTLNRVESWQNFRYTTHSWPEI